jgi:hypothetical protein
MTQRVIPEAQLISSSLTDRILRLCGTGRFGVREAIAEALKHEQQAKSRSAMVRRFNKSK